MFIAKARVLTWRNNAVRDVAVGISANCKPRSPQQVDTSEFGFQSCSSF